MMLKRMITTRKLRSWVDTRSSSDTDDDDTTVDYWLSRVTLKLRKLKTNELKEMVTNGHHWKQDGMMVWLLPEADDTWRISNCCLTMTGCSWQGDDNKVSAPGLNTCNMGDVWVKWLSMNFALNEYDSHVGYWRLPEG